MLSEKEKELARPIVENVNKLPEDGQKVFELAVMAYMLGREQSRVKESPRLNATAAAR
jgi:hypothetical protein